MEINQRPTPPNEWLYNQTFVPDPETGELVEHRSDWCTQHMGFLPDDAPVTDWPKYLYRSCTDAERREWEQEHPSQVPTPEPSPESEQPISEEGGEV